MTTTKAAAELAELRARTDREKAHAAHLWLQSYVIGREIEDEDSSALAQRIYDFNKRVDDDSVAEAIDWLSAERTKGTDPITFRIHSWGGEVFAGLALYDYLRLLRSEGVEVNTVAMGAAFSMGGLLLQAGTKRYMTPNAWLLIHEVAWGAWGKTSEIEDVASWTKRIQRQALAILAERSTLSERQIENRWKRKDWVLTAQDALNLGFIDAIAETP